MSKNLPGRSAAKMALLAAAMVPVASACADTFTYVLDGSEGSASYSKTMNGVTMSFLANPVEFESLYTFGNYPPSHNHNLDLTSPNGGYVSAFNFQFSSAVTIVGYNVGYVTGTAGTFDLTASGSTSRLGNSLASTGDHTISGGFVIAANTTGTWTANLTGSAAATIHSITVTTTVPEPGEWATIGAAACAGAALIRRRLAAK